MYMMLIDGLQLLQKYSNYLDTQNEPINPYCSLRVPLTALTEKIS